MLFASTELAMGIASVGGTRVRGPALAHLRHQRAHDTLQGAHDLTTLLGAADNIVLEGLLACFSGSQNGTAASAPLPKLCHLHPFLAPGLDHPKHAQQTGVEIE